ncbi:unnamed protein product [Notodromas monacha]|uniref:Uncharacterized protein n=1 Tax=Notodromas monacha TaxID=399045 RepID=A0A7R9BT32_9CRUS|nr:unnamed protein product [Notodromas monacha]CAG0920149.1 unnamed protein product [Notodromas monacha]
MVMWHSLTAAFLLASFFETTLSQSSYWQDGYTCGEPLLTDAELEATSSLQGREPKQARLRSE